MQPTQDASAEFLIKFWPWLEANRKNLIGTTAAVAVVLFIWYFYTTQQAQKAVDAGLAYTQLQLNQSPNATAPEASAAFLKIAGDYSGTLAAARAQLQAAAVLFDAGRYDDAQALFQKFIDGNSGSPLAAGARLGVAASLEAQNKLDLAATQYRAVTTSNPNSLEAISAKFSLAGVLAAQGKLTEATSFYQEVARSPLAGSLAQEAGRRLAQIQAKLPAAQPAAKS